MIACILFSLFSDFDDTDHVKVTKDAQVSQNASLNLIEIHNKKVIKRQFISSANVPQVCTMIKFVPELSQSVTYCSVWNQNNQIQSDGFLSGTFIMNADPSSSSQKSSSSFFIGLDSQQKNTQYSINLINKNASEMVSLFAYTQKLNIINCSLLLNVTNSSTVGNAGIVGRVSDDVILINSNFTIQAQATAISSGILVSSSTVSVSMNTVTLGLFLNATSKKSIIAGVIGQLNTSQSTTVMMISKLNIVGSVIIQCNIFGIIVGITNTNINATFFQCSSQNLKVFKCDNCSEDCCDLLIYLLPSQLSNLVNSSNTLRIMNCLFLINGQPLLQMVTLENSSTAPCPSGSSYINSTFCQCSNNLQFNDSTDVCSCNASQYLGSDYFCHQCGQNSANQILNSSLCSCIFGGNWIITTSQQNGCYCNRTQYNASGVCTFCGVDAEQTGYISTTQLNSRNSTCSCSGAGAWQTVVQPFCPCNTTSYVLLNVCVSCGFNSINNGTSVCSCIGTGSWLNDTCTPCTNQQYYYRSSCCTCPYNSQVQSTDPTSCICPPQFIWVNQTCGCSTNQYVNQSLDLCFTCGPNAVQTTNSVSQCSCSVGGVWQPTYTQSNNNCSCLTNQYLNASFGCLSCGLYSISNGDRVTSCSCQGTLGFWNSTSGYSNCTPCNTNQFLSNGSCFSCPANQVSNNLNYSQCTCPTNYQWDSSVGFCTCQLGFYYSRNQTCIQCPTGQLNTGQSLGFQTASCTCTGNALWFEQMCGCTQQQYYYNSQCNTCGNYALSGGFYNTTCSCSNSSNTWNNAITNTINFTTQCQCTTLQYLKVVSCTFCGSHAHSGGILNNSCSCDNTSYYWKVWISGSTSNNCPCLQTEFLGLYDLCDNCGYQAYTNASGDGCACRALTQQWNYSMTYLTTDVTNNCSCKCSIAGCDMSNLQNITVTAATLQGEQNAVYAFQQQSGLYLLNHSNITVQQDAMIAQSNQDWFTLISGYSQMYNVEITILNNVQIQYAAMALLDSGQTLQSISCICVNFTNCSLSAGSLLAVVNYGTTLTQTIDNCYFDINCSEDQSGSICLFVENADLSFSNFTLSGTLIASNSSALISYECVAFNVVMTNCTVNATHCSMMGNSSFLIYQQGNAVFTLNNSKIFIGTANYNATVNINDSNSYFGSNTTNSTFIANSQFFAFLEFNTSSVTVSFLGTIIGNTSGTVNISNFTLCNTQFFNATSSAYLDYVAVVGYMDGFLICNNIECTININTNTTSGSHFGFLGYLQGNDNCSVCNCNISVSVTIDINSSIYYANFIGYAWQSNITFQNNNLSCNCSCFNQQSEYVGFLGYMQIPVLSITQCNISALNVVSQGRDYHAFLSYCRDNNCILNSCSASVSANASSDIGLIIELHNCVYQIDKITIVGMAICYDWDVGFLCTYLQGNGTISHISVNANIYENYSLSGGIVGESYSNVRIQNCSVNSNVTAIQSYVGGIMSISHYQSANVIQFCTVYMMLVFTTTHLNDTIGGTFVADNEEGGNVTIVNSTAFATVSGNASSVFGSIIGTSLDNSHNAAVNPTANVTVINVTVNVTGNGGHCAINATDAYFTNVAGC